MQIKFPIRISFLQSARGHTLNRAKEWDLDIYWLYLNKNKKKNYTFNFKMY